MTTYVTVPGASNTIIQNGYNTPFNIQVAQAIANVLDNASNLFVQNYSAVMPPVPNGDIGEVAVTAPGANNIVVPSGYTFTAIDPSVTGPITVSGGGSLFAGNQNVTYYGAAASGTVSITANNGNDLVALPFGSTYDVALGGGADTVYANGSGTITVNGPNVDPNNFIFVGAPTQQGGGSSAQNAVLSYGSADTISAGAGTVTISTFGANPLIFGGTGSLEYIGFTAGNPTVFGASSNTGTETLFGGAGQDITYFDGQGTVDGATQLAAGAGNETLDAGSSSYGVGEAIGSGNVDLIGSRGADTFFGGLGAATVTGNGGNDYYIFGNNPPPQNATVTITDWNNSDTFATSGLGSSAAQTGVADGIEQGSAFVVTLSDHTTITFLNTTQNQITKTQSF